MCDESPYQVCRETLVIAVIMTGGALLQAGTLSACFITAPDETIAKDLANKIISNKLAACVNMIPKITSIYMWEGKVTEVSAKKLTTKPLNYKFRLFCRIKRY